LSLLAWILWDFVSDLRRLLMRKKSAKNNGAG